MANGINMRRVLGESSLVNESRRWHTWERPGWGGGGTRHVAHGISVRREDRVLLARAHDVCLRTRKQRGCLCSLAAFRAAPCRPGSVHRTLLAAGVGRQFACPAALIFLATATRRLRSSTATWLSAAVSRQRCCAYLLASFRATARRISRVRGRALAAIDLLAWSGVFPLRPCSVRQTWLAAGDTWC